MSSPRSWTHLVAHIVWATKQREPLILPSTDQDLARVFHRKATALGCTLLAVGCADDHVHVLARYPTVCAIATLLQSLKGASSRMHNRARRPDDLALYWQDGAWVESCGPNAIPGLVRYIHRQREHHSFENRPEPWELALFPKG